MAAPLASFFSCFLKEVSIFIVVKNDSPSLIKDVFMCGTNFSHLLNPQLLYE